MNQKISKALGIIIKYFAITGKTDKAREILKNQTIQFDKRDFPEIINGFPSFMEECEIFFTQYKDKLKNKAELQNLEAEYTNRFTHIAEDIRAKEKNAKFPIVSSTALTYSLLFSPILIFNNFPQDPHEKYLEGIICLIQAEENLKKGLGEMDH